jgi:hypothetical protein
MGLKNLIVVKIVMIIIQVSLIGLKRNLGKLIKNKKFKSSPQIKITIILKIQTKLNLRKISHKENQKSKLMVDIDLKEETMYIRN